MNPSIADRLALVLKHNGPSLLDDPDSLRRLLAPAQDPPPPEVRAILAALKSNAVQYLQKWDRHTGEKVSYAQVREHIAGSMARAGTLDAESAAWALDAWMRALMLRGDAPPLKLELEEMAPPVEVTAAVAAAAAPASAASTPSKEAPAFPARSVRLAPMGEPVATSLAPNPPPTPAHDAEAPSDYFISGGRGRPMSHGLHWWSEGWSLFTAAPLTWIAIIVTSVVIMAVTGIIPVVGMIAGVVLTPILYAGLMLGAHAVGTGWPLEFGHLFSGFRQRVGSLVAVGVLTTLLSVVAIFIVALFFGTSLMSMVALAKLDPSTLARSTGLLVAVVALTAVLLLPLSMAWYFAPALIAIDEQGPMAAIGSSLMGCLRNALPLLTYGLIFIVLAILATIPIGLGWLVLLPVAITSTYAAYRDIFRND
jgi:hypothetical protein